jgi:prepilin-type N-terminal cleavage/methylation domain-containing protein
MKNINQRGFTVLEIVLVLFLVGVVGGAGAYVYGSQKKENIPATVETTKPKTPEPTATKIKSDNELITEIIRKECGAENQQYADESLKSLKIDGKFATLAVHCGAEGGGYRSYLEKADEWKVVTKTQDTPMCMFFDGKKVPASIVPECYDEALQDIRVPKQ